jgi:hypothetical protein
LENLRARAVIEKEKIEPRDLSLPERELQAGLNSPARQMTEGDWEKLRQRIERRASAS